jgi:hypothetical protein
MMNLKSRYGECSNARTSETVKNWVFGWSVNEARVAAQRRPIVERPTVKPGMFGVLVPTDRR